MIENIFSQLMAILILILLPVVLAQDSPKFILIRICPDLKFRGRIITKNNDANYVFVANWLEHKKQYEKVHVYLSDSRECNFYVRLWNYLWGKAQRLPECNAKIIIDCKTLYEESKK